MPKQLLFPLFKPSMRKKLLIVFIASLSFCIAKGQASGSIAGMLCDSSSKATLPLATITVYDSYDTSLITFRLSNTEGLFKITGIPLEKKCRVIITYSGYKPARYELVLSSKEPSLNLDTIFLSKALEVLDSVLVRAEMPPVIVKKDTIEFNAASFKTLPNALVEDLLKKLPGVQVGRGGEIFVNGKPVTRILVDSKEFFGNDVRIATRNLPADIIDKVQVVDDEEEANRDLGLSRMEAGKIINLKLKKGIKKGSFGKLYSGLGTSGRYETGGLVNFFRDTTQVSLLAFSNNINNPAFGMDDIRDIGGFARSGYSSSMRTTGGGFALDGISFGGTGSGIQKSSGGGINLNSIVSNNTSYNLHYFISEIKSNYEEKENSGQYLGDSLLSKRSHLSQNAKVLVHNIGGTLKSKISSKTAITVRQKISLGRTSSRSNSFSTTTFNHLNLLNSSKGIEQNENPIRNSTSEILYKHNYEKRGRLLTANAIIGYSSNLTDQIDSSGNIFYNNPFHQDEYAQYRVERNPNFRIIANSSYIEPISKYISLLFTYNYTQSIQKSDIKTFLRDSVTSAYNIISDPLSNRLKRNSYLNRISIGLPISKSKVQLQPKIELATLTTNTAIAKEVSIKTSKLYYLPSIYLRWNGLNISYFTQLAEPPINNLQPVLDKTSILYLNAGNPSLKPEISRSVYSTFDKYDPKHLLTYRFLLSAIFKNNAIVSRRSIDSQGIQMIIPVNANGIGSYRANGNLTKDLKIGRNYNLSLSANLFIDHSKSKIIVNEENSAWKNWSINPSFQINIANNDFFEFSQGYTYLNQKSRYSNSYFSANRIVTHFLNSEFICRPGSHISVETSFDYSISPHIAGNLRDKIGILNAALHYTFLKNKRADIKLTAFDVLNQNALISRDISENLIRESQIQNLGRYFMATIIYDLREFRQHRLDGRNQLLRF